MDYQRQDPARGSTSSEARVAEDFVRPLKPLRGGPHRRLTAALPFAIAGIFVVSSDEGRPAGILHDQDARSRRA